MSEIHPPTVSMNAHASDRSLNNREPARYRRSKWRLLQYPAMVLMLLIVGLGAWKFAGTTSTLEEEESIADLEGFESAPPFLSPPDNRDNSKSDLSVPLPPLGETELATWDPAKLSPPNTNEKTDSANVWLNGTIEEPEPSEKIELPTRFSGVPNDSSIIR